ncbi:ABC transporter ATP-binding protein [Haladaptatus sp. NG-SE-30]
MSHDTDKRRESVLSVREVEKQYPITEGLLRRETGRVRAVHGISFDLRRGETLGLVGESGCGKSTVARMILSLESPTDGQIRFRGRDVTTLQRDERKRYRRQVQMVFQDPTSSFDPRMTIGESVAEPMVTHGLTDAERRTKRVETLLELVGLSASDRTRYPHELSGGERQRAALARVLSLNPDILVLDEPVSALDVSVQAEILALIGRLQDAFDLSILLISHDMSVVQQLCDRVMVMYLGELVERGRTNHLFDDPKHPYTRALLDAIPRPDPHDRRKPAPLSGDVPDPASPPPGCRFHTRCPKVIQPVDRSLPRPMWQGIVSLRIALRDEEFGLESIRERLTSDMEPEDGAESVDTSALRTEIRREYGLPSELDDADAERVLSNILKLVVDEQFTAAAALLADTFSTVCETKNPEQRNVEGRSVACHLHETGRQMEDSAVAETGSHERPRDLD